MTYTAWGARIDELLADGAWHEREEVIAAAAKAVPPGVAFRKGETHRIRQLGRRGQPGADRHVGTRERSVATGARTLVRDLVNSRIQRGVVEQWGTRIRRTR